jgi:membrane protease YdiL (CAAX protease family)
MSSELISSLLKVLGPLFGIIVLLVVTRRRRLSWTEDLRFVWPDARDLALWIVLWLAWMAVSEWLIAVFGIPNATAWPPYPALIIFLRILAIGILGPIVEELIFRGALYFRLSKSRTGPAGAVVIPAALWAMIHVQYGWALIAMIFVDGVILGTSRWATKSVLVPVTLHILANLFSISQSLAG